MVTVASPSDEGARMVEARAPDGGAMRRGEGRRGRDHEEEVLGHGHTPKKWSIIDLFTAALAVDGPVAAEDEEVQGDVRRRRRTSWNHRQRLLPARTRRSVQTKAAMGGSASRLRRSEPASTTVLRRQRHPRHHQCSALSPTPPPPIIHTVISSSSGGSLPMPHNDGSSSSSSPHLTLSGMDGVKVWGFGWGLGMERPVCF